MPGGRNIVGGCVRETDGKHREFLPGETEYPSKVLGMRGGDGVRVSGCPPTAKPVS